MNTWSDSKTDRASETWTALAEMYGGRLTRDLGESVPETWRRTITGLKDYEIQRGLARLLKGGQASAPSLPQFVKACKTIGDDDGPSAPNNSNTLPAPDYDVYHSHGQRCLMKYIFTNGAASDISLRKMLLSKGKIVNDFRAIAADGDEVTGSEIRDALFKSWDGLWESRTETESAADRYRMAI